MTDRLIPKKQARHVLGDISTATIDRWRSKPGFPQARVQGVRVYFAESELMEYIKTLGPVGKPKSPAP